MKQLSLLLQALLFSGVTFAQQVTISGNVQTNVVGENDGISVEIYIEELTAAKETINVTTDANGDYSAQFLLTTNPLYPAIGGQYVPATVYVSFNKTGYIEGELNAVNVDTPGTLTLDNAIISGTDLYKPNICMITVDTVTNETNIIWEREDGKNIDKYMVYKMGATDWELYEEVDFSSLSNCADPNGTNSDLYQIQAVFDDGSMSDFSNSKKLPYINIEVDQATGLPKVSMVKPDDFAKIDPSLVQKAILYRSEDGVNFYPIKEANILDIANTYNQGNIQDAYNMMSVLDENVQPGVTYKYRVGLQHFTPCSPGVLKTSPGPFSLAMSNIAESQATPNAITSPAENVNSSVKIANKTLTITTDSEIPYTILTIGGKIIASGTVSESIDILIESGMYIVQYGNKVQKILAY